MSNEHKNAGEGKSWYCIAKDEGSASVEVFIYDEIGYWGVSASMFVRDVKDALTDASELILRVNSPGGEIPDGLAIYQYLKGLDTPVTARIDGIAASMASVVVMGADTVIMPESSFLMIHNPWTIAGGESKDLRKRADVLDKMKESIAASYAERCGKSVEEINAAMSEETWFNGREAVEYGLADLIAEPQKMAALADLSAFGNVPGALMARATESKKMKDNEALKAQIEELNGNVATITGERDALATEKAGFEDNRKEAFDEGVGQGADQERGRITARLEKYDKDSEFVLAHIDKTDAEIQDAYIAVLKQRAVDAKDEAGAQGAIGQGGTNGTEGGGGSVEDTPEAYNARVKELRDAGKTAGEAHRTARIEFGRVGK